MDDGSAAITLDMDLTPWGGQVWSLSVASSILLHLWLTLLQWKVHNAYIGERTWRPSSDKCSQGREAEIGTRSNPVVWRGSWMSKHARWAVLSWWYLTSILIMQIWQSVTGRRRRAKELVPGVVPLAMEPHCSGMQRTTLMGSLKSWRGMLLEKCVGRTRSQRTGDWFLVVLCYRNIWCQPRMAQSRFSFAET